MKDARGGGTGPARLDDSDAKVRLAAAIADRGAMAATLGDLRVNLGNAERELSAGRLFKRGFIAERRSTTARTTVESFRARIALVLEQVVASEPKIHMAQQGTSTTASSARRSTASWCQGFAARRDGLAHLRGGGFTRTAIATSST